MPLTLEQIRAIQLAATGLLEPPAAPASPAEVLAAVRKMGVLQIDTIHVVARSPYLVLWSRVGDYNPRWLDQLLADGALFEHWAHAACFIPMEDYPLYRRGMLDGMHGWLNSDGWLGRHRDLADLVLGRIRAEGALRSADFESKKDPGGWWNWKAEKRTLEYLLARGDLMVRSRQSFQRVYDLRERILPDWDDSRTPGSADARQAFILKTAHCLGVMRASWTADYFRLTKTGMARELASLADRGLLLAEKAADWEDPVYLHSEQAALLERARRGELVPTYTTLLSPFDPLVWDRRRARELFQFDYTIECYLPEAKRRYGYFSLPILHRGALVGRLAAKAHRKDKVFEVRNLVLEAGTACTTELIGDLRKALHSCAAWHGTPQVRVQQCEPAGLLEALAAD